MATNAGPHDSTFSNPGGRSGSRHQLKRSITDFTSPSKLGRRAAKDRDREIPLYHPISANPYVSSRTSVDLMPVSVPRSEGVTPLISPDQSRRPSVRVGEDENTTINPTLVPEHNTKPEESVKQKQEKASLQAQDLKQSLANINAFSATTARRLDETYYSALEKLSTLQSTVTALKGLASTSRSICDEFQRDSHEIENDITTQIESMGHFEQHQENIETLQTRIQGGRSKIRSLSSRVDVVRERVELWERLNQESEDKTRRRLRAIWICMSVIVLTMIVLLLGARYMSPNGELVISNSQDKFRAGESIVKSHKADGGLRGGEASSVAHEGAKSYSRKIHDRMDEELRILDEL